MKFDLSKVELSKEDLNRGLILPKESSKELAEFIGILAGDGYVSFNTNRNVISVSGDSRYDYKYLKKHVKPLIKKLFNLGIKVHKRKRARYAEIWFSSKGIINFLKYLGYYKHKSRNIKIPDWIIGDDSFKLSFLKGLADTDFSLMLYKNRKIYPIYPIISICSVCNKLIDFVEKWLNRKGFLVYTRRNEKTFDKRTKTINVESRLRLTGRQNLKLWMKLIGFRNERHLNKYKEYLSSGNISKQIGRPSIKLKALEVYKTNL